jgi:hypothetical protein
MVAMGNRAFPGLFTLLRRRSYRFKKEEIIKRRASGAIKTTSPISRMRPIGPEMR